jgi:hypothetical protein
LLSMRGIEICFKNVVDTILITAINGLCSLEVFFLLNP